MVSVETLPAGSAAPLDDLPLEIARDRDEAWRCFYGGQLRAATIMARAALQRAVRSLGAQGKGLKAEIGDLVDRGLVPHAIAPFAREVRIAGDDAAHPSVELLVVAETSQPSTLGDVDADIVRENLDFLDDFLRVTIAMPARAQHRQEGRRKPTQGA